MFYLNITNLKYLRKHQMLIMMEPIAMEKEYTYGIMSPKNLNTLELTWMRYDLAEFLWKLTTDTCLTAKVINLPWFIYFGDICCHYFRKKIDVMIIINTSNLCSSICLWPTRQAKNVYWLFGCYAQRRDCAKSRAASINID